MSSKSSRLLHLDPLAIALEKRRHADEPEAERAPEPQKNRLSILSSQTDTDNQTQRSSLSNVGWQPKTGVDGGPMGNQPTLDSQPILDSQIENSFDLLASLPEQKGDLRVPHRYTDHLCRLLKPDEQAVYWQLYRLSWGWGKSSCFISNPKLSERSNVPLTSMKRAIAGLIAKGIVTKTGHTNGYGKDQGVEYRLPNLGSQSTSGSQPDVSSQPNLDTIKHNSIKEHTQTQNGVGVGGKSKYSLKECQRYAEHLKSTGQGITNPGGYATKIHRTGEADDMIETFLKPAPQKKRVDASRCPDCHGTGYYYPQGKEHGVARCKHERLHEGAPEEAIAT